MSHLIVSLIDVGCQGLHLTLEDVVFLNIVFNRGQVLSEPFVVQIPL